MEEKDFSKLWGSNGSIATITDDQYQQGWVYIGDNKPTRAQFNAWQQWSDQKAYWLYQNKLGINDTAKAAKKLESERIVKISGAVEGEAKFDGSGNVEIKAKQNGFDASLAKTGWHKDPTGKIEQWGSVTGVSEPQGTKLINFPIFFPKECFDVRIGMVSSKTSRVEYVQVVSWDRTGAVVATYDDVNKEQLGQLTFTWSAVGV